MIGFRDLKLVVDIFDADFAVDENGMASVLSRIQCHLDTVATHSCGADQKSAE